MCFDLVKSVSCVRLSLCRVSAFLVKVATGPWPRTRDLSGKVKTELRKES